MAYQAGHYKELAASYAGYPISPELEIRLRLFRGFQKTLTLVSASPPKIHLRNLCAP